jgi:DNA-directed RNA polymerase subunit M/transcription elongation factor TFIIS
MSYIVWSRKCKKCKGQFYLEENEDGTYLVCIQCGYSERIVDEELVALLSAVQTKDNKKKDMSEV